MEQNKSGPNRRSSLNGSIDKAPMVNRHALESLDRTFKDIMEVNLPFGGKVLILGGDFRQVFLVVPKGTKAEMIDACIVKSPL